MKGAKSRFILLLTTVNVTCLAVAYASPQPAVTALASAPLVLYLPGATLLVGIDPHGHVVDGLERVFWSGAASIAVAISGGFVLNVVGGLTRLHWLVLLGLVTAAACVLGWLRVLLPGSRRDGQPPATIVGTPAPAQPLGPTPRSPSRSLALLVGATLVLVGSLTLSYVSNAAATREHFVQFWLLPNPPTAGAYAAHAQLGILNSEGRTEVFEVVLLSEARLSVSHWRVVLANGRTWTYGFSRKPLEPLTATLSLAARPSDVLRTVTLAVPQT